MPQRWLAGRRNARWLARATAGLTAMGARAGPDHPARHARTGDVDEEKRSRDEAQDGPIFVGPIHWTRGFCDLNARGLVCRDNMLGHRARADSLDTGVHLVVKGLTPA